MALKLCSMPVINMLKVLVCFLYYECMAKKKIATGLVHEVPADLRKALLSDESALERCEDLTPLVRNEYDSICTPYS